MERGILAQLKDGAGFSKGQRRIAAYILENYDKAAFMTASRLGQLAGVSESTVVRFASELGYDGYPGMRKALQDTIRSRLTSVQRIEVARETMDEENVLESVLMADIDKLHITLVQPGELQSDGGADRQRPPYLHRGDALIHLPRELPRFLSEPAAGKRPHHPGHRRQRGV